MFSGVAQRKVHQNVFCVLRQPAVVLPAVGNGAAPHRVQRRVTFAFVCTLKTACVRSYIFWSECDGDQGIKLTLTSKTKQ